MRLTLNRHPSGLTCTIGDLLVDGELLCHTLEDPVREQPGVPVSVWKVAGDTAIPAGVYDVQLTFSDRAAQGYLWTPLPDYKLPQVMNVPGFEGIRIHAGNTDNDTEGCILVGSWTGGEFLHNSRGSLQSLLDTMNVAMIGNLPITIEVCNP